MAQREARDIKGRTAGVRAAIDDPSHFLSGGAQSLSLAVEDEVGHDVIVRLN